MKTVLITGAEGNIGSRLLQNLAGRYELRALTREPVPGLASTVADAADLDAIEPAFAGVDAVVHLAASAGVGTPWPEVLHNNIEGTYAVFEAARQAGVRQLIFASSNHAVGGYEVEAEDRLYRPRAGVMLDQHTLPRPDSLYGVSKVFGEALGRYYSDAFGMSVYCLRIAWVRPEELELPDDLQGIHWPPKDHWIAREELRLRLAAFWLSHADMAGLVDACLRAEHVRFGIYYGVSNNPLRFWSLDNALADLGWQPRDAAPLPVER
jgi:NAD+ dependent glucose-6-phosphate dehydrogenase